MTVDQGAQAGFVALVFVLVLSSLAARRLSFGRTIAYMLSWVAIFFGGFLLFTYRDAFAPVLDRIATEVSPATPTLVGDTVRIKMSADGHFWVDGRIGTEKVRFLIDSGATMTALSSKVVERAGLDIDTRRPMILRTANGDIRADRVTVPELAVGSIRADGLSAVTTEGFGGINVLGMNFLSGLRRWGVEDKTLILTPKS